METTQLPSHNPPIPKSGGCDPNHLIDVYASLVVQSMLDIPLNVCNLDMHHNAINICLRRFKYYIYRQ